MSTPASSTRTQVHHRRIAGWLFATGLLLAVGTIGCSRDAESGNVTFASDVAELIYTSCTPCHLPGETAPFALLGYDDVYKRRNKLVEVTS